MRYILRQQWFTIKDSFIIRDPAGQHLFRVKGKLISIGEKLRMKSLTSSDRVVIKQKLLRMRPTYFIYINGKLQARVAQRMFTVLRDKFVVHSFGGPNLEIVGDIFAHEYRFLRAGREVARVSKRWISVTDKYGVQVDEPRDGLLCLACAIVIDMISHNSSARPE